MTRILILLPVLVSLAAPVVLPADETATEKPTTAAESVAHRTRH